MEGKKNRPSKGMTALKISVPADTADWARAEAVKEGITMQAVLAPLLNAFARGEIKRGDYTRKAA